MSNYTQAVFYGPKDSLLPGDPLKAIKGTEIDEELSRISTAIASKAETVSTTVLPLGMIVPYAAVTAPDSNWLICNGAAVSRTTYSALFAIIGTTYGVGDSSTTFNLPDLEGRVVAGKEPSASRLTSGGGGVDGGTLAATGGNETHTLTIPEMPSHNHSTPDDANALINAAGSSSRKVLSGSTNTGLTGGGGAHANVQPTIILQYIIRVLNA